MEKDSYETYWVFNNNLRFIEEADYQWEQAKTKRNFRLLKKNIMSSYNNLAYHENQASETNHVEQFKVFKEKLLEFKNSLAEKEKQINNSEPDYTVVDMGEELNEKQRETIQRLVENSLNLRTPPQTSIKELLQIKDRFTDEKGKQWFETTLERLQNGFQINQHTDDWVRYSEYDFTAKNMEKYYEQHPEERRQDEKKSGMQSKIPKI